MLRFIFLMCGTLLLTFSLAQAQGRDTLNYSIVGSVSSGKSPSFGKSIKHIEVQRLLLDISAFPREASFVDSALKGSGVTRKDLEDLRLIRCRDGRCKLSFTLFRAGDIETLHRVCGEFSQSLAHALLLRRTEIDSVLATYSAPGIDRGAVAYIALGCVSLDWDGLKVTADEHYRLTESERPDGNYVPYAEEKSPFSRRAIYWGSNNNSYGNIQLTSFGDHFSLPRRSFPDVMWSDDSAIVPKELRTLLDSLPEKSAKDKEEKLYRCVGAIMLELREKSSSAEELARIASVPQSEIGRWLDALSALHYVSAQGNVWQATIPVFTRNDRLMLEKLRGIGREVMTSWLKENYAKLRAQLSGLSTGKNEVPFEEGFTMIWHFIFGMANQRLVEAGLFADPYGPARTEKGFIPAVFDWDALSSE